MIPGAAFEASWESYFFERFVGRLGPSPANLGCVYAPAPLPDGALLMEMQAFVADKNVTEDFGLVLWQKDNQSTDAAVEIARIATTGVTPDPATFESYEDTEINYIVDNTNFNLFLAVAIDSTFCLSTDHSIFGVRLIYVP